jgi:dTDP-4-dehydrorhamnose 3,5-epimerase
MKIIEYNLKDAFLIQTNFSEDSRGAFLKIFAADNDILRNYTVRQINYVTSVQKHTLRGLHYQQGEFAEGKIFRAVNGAAQVAFVDVRPDSTSYLQAQTIILEDPRQAVVIPRGFATGYCTLADITIMLYLSDNDYNLNSESGLRWDDPKLHIDWLVQEPILSEKDKGWALVS